MTKPAEMEKRYQALIPIVEAAAPTGIRFVYYRAVAEKLVDKTEAGYAKVQRAILHLRQNERIPWDSITDSTRWMRKPTTWNSVDDMLANAASSYRLDLWTNCTSRVEVWCESESVASVIMPVTYEWGVPAFPVKGQSSATFAYGAAMEYKYDPRPVRIFYFGDHDPAGLEIEASLTHKLKEYSGRDDIALTRLGCTPDQAAERQAMGTKPKKKTWKHPTEGKLPFEGLAVEAEAIDAPLLRAIAKVWIETWADKDEVARLRAQEERERADLLALAQWGKS